MSTISNPAPTPAQESGQAASPPPGRSSRWKLLGLAGVLVVGAVIAWQLAAEPAAVVPAGGGVRVPTATVTTGPINRTMRLGGVTSSVTYVNVRAPRTRGGERQPLVLLELMESGERVKTGEVAAVIDGQGAKDHIDDTYSTVLASLTDIKKRRAEQEIDRDNMRQDIEVAKAELDQWKLEAGAAEIRTVIDREIINLAVEEAEAAYKQKLADIEVQKSAQTAELRILEITSERHKRHVQRHEFDLERYTVNVPMDGMVVRQKVFRSGEMAVVRKGDQMRPGRLFLKVMDTSRMQIEAKINQVESNNFRVGQQVRVGLDAFPGAEFQGKIYSIGALAKGSASQGGYVREIPVHIHVEGNDPRLIPDLSAYGDVLIDRVEDAVQIPRAAVFEEEGETFVFVRQGSRYEKRSVELGLRNYTHVAVVSGLEAGEEVALERPAAAPQTG